MPDPEMREAIDQVIASAKRFGVEFKEQNAIEWVRAMQAEATGGDIVVDVDSGVFGHRTTMLDLKPSDLVRYRRMAPIVGIDSRPGVVTALALSGSAAQSRIHSYPSDADFFERIHISAPSRQTACTILAEVIRDKALATMSGPTHRLWEVKFGTYDADVTKDGKLLRRGSPINWTAAEVAAGEQSVIDAEGLPRLIKWIEGAREPGWCKIDWIMADADRGQLANVSNMLDPTWEAPDGTIESLDGFLDPYFQEVYLDTDALPLFEKIVREVSTDAVDEYIAALEKECVKYSGADPNWGKVARRLYNIFRLSGHFAEAAYIRELFDEPATVLYQVAALIRTIDEAAAEGTPFKRDLLLAQCDQLIMSAIGALSGATEAVVVSHLLKLRDDVSGVREGDRGQNVIPIRDETLGVVNEYFRERLLAIPSIAAYLEELTAPKV